MRVHVFFFAFLYLMLAETMQAQEFITRWDLSAPGSSPTSISFSTETTGPVAYAWETIPAASTGSGFLNSGNVIVSGLPSGAMIRLRIDSAGFNRFVMLSSPDRLRLKDVEQWGTVAWTNMEDAFVACDSMHVSANDIPDLDSVSSMKNMFNGCYALNLPASAGNWNTSHVQNMDHLFCNTSINAALGTWNTANVTDMSGMFLNTNMWGQSLGGWNTGNVTEMDSMFYNAYFNDPGIGNWNTGSVTNMSGMFYNSGFNQPIGNWNTSNVTDMSYMFYDAGFNQPIGNWNTSSVTNMSYMFYNAGFNQPIGNWNTGNVTNMSWMFANSAWNPPPPAVYFDQPIGNWNTGSVTDMSFMFYESLFNQPIGSWNTSNVTNMRYMFGHSAFNQPIGNWNTGNVTDMSGMFYGGPSGGMGLSFFNQPIGNWNTGAVTDMSNMFGYSPVFNQPIGGWNTSNVTNMSGMFNNPVNGCPFNQPIGTWNTANVTNMAGMLSNCYNFNQDLSTWNMASIDTMLAIFDCSALDCGNYGQTLIGWAGQNNLPNGQDMGFVFTKLGFGGNCIPKLHSPQAISAKNYLVTQKGWQIFDGGPDNSCGVVTHFGTAPASGLTLGEWYPNPAVGNPRIDLELPAELELKVALSDMLGRTLLTEIWHPGAGHSTMTLDAQALPSGQYQVAFSAPSVRLIRRLFIEK